MILNQTLNSAEKRSMSNNFGFYTDIQTSGDMDSTFNICQPINTGAASTAVFMNNGKSFTFALPLVGLLNTAKQFPMINGDITVELTLNAISNWLVGNSALAIANISGLTASLSNMELVVDQLILTPESYTTIMSAYPEKLHIKSQSYDFGTGQTFTGAQTGALDIPINVKRSSLKQVLFYFTQSNLIDKTYGGVNPNGTDIVFCTNGVQYPQRPMRLTNPSECFNQVQKAYGSLYSNSHGGSMGKAEFCRRSTPNGNYLTALTSVVPGDITVSSNKFYLAIDTEVVNYDAEKLIFGYSYGS